MNVRRLVLGVLFFACFVASPCLNAGTASNGPAGPYNAFAACAPDEGTLCLNSSRFRVQTQWVGSEGQTGGGHAVALTGDTGYFWFFSSTNVEMVTKLLDACPLNNKFWYFAGGLTNVKVVTTVLDTKTGATKTYTNPPNTTFVPIQDTSAFGACP